MKIYTIGIDLGKTSFHLVGLNERGDAIPVTGPHEGYTRLALRLAKPGQPGLMQLNPRA